MTLLSHDAPYERQVQVIRLRKAGLTYDAIAAQAGLSRRGYSTSANAIRKIAPRHFVMRSAGASSVSLFKTLTAEQGREVQRLIRDKAPDQIKQPYALWSRAAAELIVTRYGIRVQARTMGTYLRRWIGTAYPEIAARAKKGCSP